ncbi:MAG: putative tyrosine recombinase XerC-like protein [Methanoregula sp. PtaU1.Bin051]|nr:MAG: putative tyrosine recombinase XerC-like protein [Methanoregula sp. PtaU1.Bin051]
MTLPPGQKSDSVSRFHTTDTKYREYAIGALQRAMNSKKITADDADLIREFTTEIKATSKKISPARIFKIVVTLISLREFFPHPFRQSTLKDIFSVRDKLESAQKPDGTPRYKQNTIADFIRFEKRFFLWMVESGYSSVPTEKLEEIRPPAYRYDSKTADDIFTKEQIHAMLTACQNSRDRAIIAVLYDGALRVGELGTLRWNQVKFTDVDAVLTIQFKTEKTRTIPLFMAREYLAQWKNDYPGTPEGDNFVFLTSGGGRNRKGRHQLQYAGVLKRVRKIAARAGIEKKIVPHLFRHSRITHLITDGAQESTIKLLAWGHLTTNMIDLCYGHITPSDVRDEMARLAGVTINAKPRTKALDPRQCPQCGMINGPTLNWCAACGFELTAEARDKVRIAAQQAELWPEFQVMKEQIAELQKQLIAGNGAGGVRNVN